MKKYSWFREGAGRSVVTKVGEVFLLPIFISVQLLSLYHYK
jgi:hypothetical protein